MSGGTTAIVVVAAVLGAVVICFVILYLVFLGRKRTISSSVEGGDADHVDVKLESRFGEVELRGGGSRLLEADFTSNVRGFKPSIEYSVQAGRGQLGIGQKPPSWFAGWLGRTHCTLRFGESVPVNLTADLGTGDGDLELGGLALEELRVKAMAGRAKVETPGEMGRLEKVAISQSAGDIALVMEGRYPAMKTLDVKNSAGDTRINLRGEWSRDLECTISSKAGSIRIEVPSDVGVSVKVMSRVGDVKARDMTRTPEGVYTNSAMGSSAVTLRLSVDSTAGEIRIIPA